MNDPNTEIADLASEGFFYPTGSALSSGTVEISPITAAEEDLLCSGNLLKRGLVLPRLLSRILRGVNEIDTLLQCDLETVLLNARILNYGASGKVQLNCSECEESFESEISFAFQSVPFSFAGLQRGTNALAFVLPKSAKTLIFKLPTWKEHNDWMPLGWFEFAKRITLAIDGEEDAVDFIENRMTGIDSKAFRDFYEHQTPGFRTSWKIKCAKCGHISTVKVPISTDVFNIRPESKSAVHDEIFSLCYHSNGAFTHDEVYAMPVSLRSFYIKRLVDLKNEENNQTKKREAEMKASAKSFTKPSLSKPSVPSGKH